MIKETFEKKLYVHITEHLEKDFDCTIRIINGTADHVHILFFDESEFCYSRNIQEHQRRIVALDQLAKYHKR